MFRFLKSEESRRREAVNKRIQAVLSESRAHELDLEYVFWAEGILDVGKNPIEQDEEIASRVEDVVRVAKVKVFAERSIAAVRASGVRIEEPETLDALHWAQEIVDWISPLGWDHRVWPQRVFAANQLMRWMTGLDDVPAGRDWTSGDLAYLLDALLEEIGYPKIAARDVR
jgi:hypothetical protein